MATIDLGKIKQVFRGTYNNATAYVPDDLVVFTDTGITSTYICTTASTGNNPSSGGTAHANWAYIAKGVTDPIPSQSGNAGKVLKTDGSNLSFGVGGGVLQVKETVNEGLYYINPADWAIANAAFKVDITATSTTSHFILECFMGCGCDTHDDMFSASWFDSLVGTSSANILFQEAAQSGNRTRGVFPLFPAGAAVSGGWDSYWFSGQYFSAKYYPAAGQRSTSARSFYPCFKRNGHASAYMSINYGKDNHSYNFNGKSIIRVTEIAGDVT